MFYTDVLEGIFVKRMNRFTALAVAEGRERVVHVKNTGRLGELLVEGRKVILQKKETPARKTAYDLICAYDGNGKLFNIDSMAPNRAMEEYLSDLRLEDLRREVTYGESRMDFSFTENGRRAYMEVKGCTLIEDGKGVFPDAPTTRGTRHIKELIRAVREGYGAYLVFVIQTEGVDSVVPNRETDWAFSAMYDTALEKGVRVMTATVSLKSDFMAVTGLNLMEKHF